MSYKNKLQEYCQKYKLTLPVYQLVSHQFDTKSNIHRFQSSVSIDNNIYVSDILLTKKKSEIDAAKNAIENLSKINIKHITSYVKYNKPKTINRVILVDIENMPLYFEKNKCNSDDWLIGFISKWSHYYGMRDTLSQYCTLNIVDSSDNNAADTMMIFIAGFLVSSGYQKFVLISRDKFSNCLKTIIETSKNNCTCKCITSYN